MRLKLDLHVHTSRSADAFTRLSELPQLLKRRGLDGAALTDHDQPATFSEQGVLIVPGIEVSSSQGHVIGLGIRQPLSRGLSADQTISEIHRLNGVAIIPHPYDLFRSSVNPDNLTTRPDAIEVVNASSFLHTLTWKKARQYAERTSLPMVGGSDSHIPQTLGRGYTVVQTVTDDSSSILEAIRKGSVTPAGGPITTVERLRKLGLALRNA